MSRSRLSARRAVAYVAAAALLTLAACGGDDSSNDASSNDDVTTSTTESTSTTAELTTETTDTTLASGVDETTTTTAAASATTLPGSTPTTARRTTTTVRRGATTTTIKRATTTTAAPTVAKGTVKIGLMYNSIQASTGARTLEEARKVGQAWEAQTNGAGGINGYKVQILFRDNRGDIARSVQSVKDLEQAGVLAIAGSDAAAQLPANARYLNDRKLPIVGGVPYTPEFNSDPMFFPVSAGFYAGVYGQMAAARDVGAKSVAYLYCAEVAACASAVPVARAAAERENLKFYADSGSAVATDYTSHCLKAKQSNVDFVQSGGFNFANLVRDCSRQNYHPVYGVGGFANQATIDAAKGDSLAGNLYEFGIFYNGPEVQRFRQALATTDLTVTGSTPAGQNSVQAWLGLEMAGAALKRMTQASPTRQDFLNALYSIKGENLGGQISPVDYTVQRPGTGSHAGNDCWTEHIVKDGQYFPMNKSGQAVDRVTFICGTGKTYTSQAPS